MSNMRGIGKGCCGDALACCEPKFWFDDFEDPQWSVCYAHALCQRTAGVMRMDEVIAAGTFSGAIRKIGIAANRAQITLSARHWYTSTPAYANAGPLIGVDLSYLTGAGRLGGAGMHHFISSDFIGPFTRLQCSVRAKQGFPGSELNTQELRPVVAAPSEVKIVLVQQTEGGTDWNAEFYLNDMLYWSKDGVHLGDPYEAPNHGCGQIQLRSVDTFSTAIGGDLDDFTYESIDLSSLAPNLKDVLTGQFILDALTMQRITTV